MNSAYPSTLRLTSSSRRTCRVVVFGCLDGAFRSAMCFLSFRHLRFTTFRTTTCFLRLRSEGNARSRFLRDGRERPHGVQRRTVRHWAGSLPPHPGFGRCLSWLPFLASSRLVSPSSLHAGGETNREVRREAAR